MSFGIFSKIHNVVAIFKCIQKQSIKDREMIFVVLCGSVNSLRGSVKD